jgi:hypothetical protein
VVAGEKHLRASGIWIDPRHIYLESAFGHYRIHIPYLRSIISLKNKIYIFKKVLYALLPYLLMWALFITFLFLKR